MSIRPMLRQLPRSKLQLLSSCSFRQLSNSSQTVDKGAGKDDVHHEQEGFASVLKQLDHYLPERLPSASIARSEQSASLVALLTELSHQKPLKQQENLINDVRGAQNLPEELKPDQIVFIEATDRYLTEFEFVKSILPGATSYLLVLPCRDSRASYTRTNRYCLIFPDAKSAFQWSTHVLGKSSSPTAHSSDPNRGPRFSGSELVAYSSVLGHVFAQTFNSEDYLKALGPVLTTKSVEEKDRQLKAFSKEVRARGAFTTARTAVPVLLRVSGIDQLALSELIQSLLYDGLKRNMLWDVQLNGSVLGIGGFRDGEGKDASLVSLEDVIEIAQSVENDEDIGDESAFPKSPKKLGSTTWLLPFTSTAGATRFVRTWNHRPLPTPPSLSARNRDQNQWRFSREYGEDILVTTELL